MSERLSSADYVNFLARSIKTHQVHYGERRLKGLISVVNVSQISCKLSLIKVNKVLNVMWPIQITDLFWQASYFLQADFSSIRFPMQFKNKLLGVFLCIIKHIEDPLSSSLRSLLVCSGILLLKWQNSIYDWICTIEQLWKSYFLVWKWLITKDWGLLLVINVTLPFLLSFMKVHLRMF